RAPGPRGPLEQGRLGHRRRPVGRVHYPLGIPARSTETGLARIPRPLFRAIRSRPTHGGAMKLRKLGRTGLKVSNLCLGTMTFGNTAWGCDEPTSARIVSRFLDAGGNFIDTADVYSTGVSEEITGRAIRNKRAQVVLATKVAGPMGGGANDLGLSRKHVLDGIDASLRRLGTDYVDLYQVHPYDPTTPLHQPLGPLAAPL